VLTSINIGEMSMTLQTLIKDKIAEKGSKEISKLLGYHSTTTFDNRVQKVRESPYLALDQSDYDFHYGSHAFIKKLLEALEIPEHFYNKVIEEVEEALELDRQKKPYFFLETNFKRESQPIFMLSALQNNRFLSVGEEIYKLSLNDQLSKLADFIRHHNEQYPVIDVWGEIQSYVYFYDDETALVFSTSGQLLSAKSDYFYSQAYMSLK